MVTTMYNYKSNSSKWQLQITYVTNHLLTMVNCGTRIQLKMFCVWTPFILYYAMGGC
jgi:hypothetical protein